MIGLIDWSFVYSAVLIDWSFVYSAVTLLSSRKYNTHSPILDQDVTSGQIMTKSSFKTAFAQFLWLSTEVQLRHSVYA